jgi:hypothetical protein
MSTNHDQSCALLQAVSLSPAFSTGQVSLGNLNRQLTCVCFMWSEILTAVNIHRSISQFYHEDENSKLLRNTDTLVVNLVHVLMSVRPHSLPRHCYITLLLSLAKSILSKTWLRPNSLRSIFDSGKRFYLLLKTSRPTLEPMQHHMLWTLWVLSPCIKR